MRPYLHVAPAPGGSDRQAAASPARVRVVLADDHLGMRRSLRLLLDGEEDLDVVAEAADNRTVMRLVWRHRPHVLVLDHQLPNGSTIEMIRTLREETPETEAVLITMEDNPLFARRALDAGAVGFVIKDRADTELAEAVRCAARGEEYVSPRTAATLEALRRSEAGDGLRPRELEILRLISLGYTSREIAEMFHLSHRTIESHRARIHRKLGLATRHELVDYALRQHLIGN